ncbi:MAG: AI-2E family transporter, partial [Gramella sp.]|nr:AI-2E family transporter [Christiangramia sp.]
MDRLKPSLVRQIFVLLLILFLTVLIVGEVMPYLSGVLGAVTLYVILKGWMKKLVNRGWRPPLAATVLMAGSFVGILIPVTLITIMLTSKIGKAVANSERVLSALKQQLNIVEANLGYNLSSSIDTTSITNWVSSNLQNLAGGTFNAFIAIGIMYFMLYYMLTNRESMRESMITYIPLGKDNLRIIGEESNQLVKSNALGIPLVAIVQGIIALIGFLIFG